MNKFMLKVAAIAASICVLALGALYVMSATEKSKDKWNLFLSPIELIGTEDSGNLAFAYTQENYIVAYDRVYERDFTRFEDIDSPEMSDFMRYHPGVYTWVDWTWASKEYQEKYAPVYGSGVWVYKPAS